MAMFLIEIPELNGMTKPETAQYLEDAISCWANGSCPEHSFYGRFLNKADGTLKVKTLTTQQLIVVKAALLRFG